MVLVILIKHIAFIEFKIVKVLSTIQSNIYSAYQYLKKVFQDEQFYVSLRHVTGSFIPLVAGEILGYESAGLTMMIGCFVVSGVDMAGTFRSKAKALFYTNGIGLAVTFLLLVSGNALLFQLPLLFIFIFAFSYISLFILRYMLIAIMGYIVIIIALSMIGRFNSLAGILHFCFLMLCGSLWYCTFALVMQHFTGTHEINRRIAHCMRQTADYFDQRLALLESC